MCWYKEIVQYCSEAMPVVVLVGCMNDLEDKRCVSFEEASVLRVRYGMGRSWHATSESST